MRRLGLMIVLCTSLAACGDAVQQNNDSWNLSEDDDTTDDDTTDDDTTDDDTTDDDSCLPHAPDNHRPMSRACDDTRGPGTAPDFGGDWDCEKDADCTDGDNGRCTGNGHDGWRCTYDNCFDDSGCAEGSVCQCEGGFRSDNNVCLPGNCVTDADCGETGYCGPSKGDCGDYLGTVGYFCHTCEDECVNDSDCTDGDGMWGAPYCMFDPALGHRRCSDSQCVG